MTNGSQDLKIVGGTQLSGTVTTESSKNGSVALLCAALINKGETTLQNIAFIEEIHRLIEVLEAIGVTISRKDTTTLTITPPECYPPSMTTASFSRIRSGVMLIPAIAQTLPSFTLPLIGGCKMGKRTLIAHTSGLKRLGIAIQQFEQGLFVTRIAHRENTVVLYEMSDTATVNILLAAATLPQITTITFASANYQVQEVCFFLKALGILVEGIGTSTLKVHGVNRIEKNITYTNSEDPIESMTFLSLAVATQSLLTIQRAPIEFLTLELFTLENMGLQYKLSERYRAENGETQLVDITVYPSQLTAPEEKLHSLPYPGINTDNLPFFVPIALKAKGDTLIHDWMWENRAIYYTYLNHLGAKVLLLDQHRAKVSGEVRLKPAHLVCPPALRPAMVVLIAMLMTSGESRLRDTYSIHRGYANIVERLKKIGAQIEVL